MQADFSAAYVKLAALMACSLHSWDLPNTGTTPEELVREYILSLTEKENHAPLLTSRMLLYIACGRNGVTMPSLIGMLLNDKDVFNEFDNGLHYPLCCQQIPVSVLSRLYYALTPFLVHTPMLGEDIVTFSFDAFKMVVEKDYFSEEVIQNAIDFYSEQDINGTDGVLLSELPYLLLKYRGERDFFIWQCRDGHICRRLKLGLKNEFLTDLRMAGDSKLADCVRRITIARILDFERCPEAAESILFSEAEVLHNKYHGSDELPDFKTTGGNVNIVTWDRMAACELKDELAALAELICRTNNERYINQNNTIVLIHHAEPFKATVALLFTGRSEDFVSAAETMKDYMDIRNNESAQIPADDSADERRKKSEFFNRKVKPIKNKGEKI